MTTRPTSGRAQTGTHAHAPVPRHAALRPAWRLSGWPARCNAAPLEPPTLDVVNVRGSSRLSPVRYVTVWSCRGVDERGATGALPGAAAGRRVPASVPPAGGPEVAAEAVGRRGADAPGAAGPVSGVAGRVARNPSPGPRPRSCSSRSAIWTCRYWRPLSCPGASGVMARGSLPGGRERVAAGRPACQRAARVLRDAPALRVTRRPPRGSDGNCGPCGPALDGASRPTTTLTGTPRTAGFASAPNRSHRPRRCSRYRPRNRRCGSTYAVSSGVSFQCRQGVSFECRLTASVGCHQRTQGVPTWPIARGDREISATVVSSPTPPPWCC